jgi:hypothetical protein
VVSPAGRPMVGQAEGLRIPPCRETGDLPPAGWRASPHRGADGWMAGQQRRQRIRLSPVGTCHRRSIGARFRQVARMRPSDGPFRCVLSTSTTAARWPAGGSPTGCRRPTSRAQTALAALSAVSPWTPPDHRRRVARPSALGRAYRRHRVHRGLEGTRASSPTGRPCRPPTGYGATGRGRASAPASNLGRSNPLWSQFLVSDA